MNKLEKFVNNVILGVLAFTYYALATIGVHQYVKASEHMAWAISTIATLGLSYGMYLLIRWSR